jgi:hypothetical protein
VLEQKSDLSAQLGAPSDKRARDREQHRRMSVVTAGVHDAVRLRSELDTAFLLDRKRVNVRSERQRRAWPSARQPSDNARRRWARDLERTERGESLSNEASRFVLVERELRVRMEMAPPGNRLTRDSINAHKPERTRAGFVCELREATVTRSRLQRGAVPALQATFQHARTCGWRLARRRVGLRDSFAVGAVLVAPGGVMRSSRGASHRNARPKLEHHDGNRGPGTSSPA